MDLELVPSNLVKSNSHLLLADTEQIDAEQRQIADQLASLRNSTAANNSGITGTTSNTSSSTFLPPPGLSLNSSNSNGRGSASLDHGGDENSLTNGLLNNVIDTTTRFSKLDLFDDNNSFFSTNTFHQPYLKLEQQQQHQFHGAGDTINTNSPQLPDLLNGTETNKERNQQQLHDASDKLNLLKGLGDFGTTLQQQGYNTNGERVVLCSSMAIHITHSFICRQLGSP